MESSNKGQSGRHMMWMIPRTVSTAIIKSMSLIPDVEIWFEPFGFANFAIRSMKHFHNVDLPLEYRGNEADYDIAAGHVSSVFNFNTKMDPEKLSYDSIKRMLEESTSKYVFVKDESSMRSWEKYLKYLPRGYSHSFLIRHPVLVYTSMRLGHYKQSKESREGGLLHDEETDLDSYDMRKHNEFFPHFDYYQSIHSLWKYVRENIDPCPTIIDSSDVLSNPAEMLPKYCEAIGFPDCQSLLELDVPGNDVTKWVWPSNELAQNEIFLTKACGSTKLHPPKKPLPRDQLSDDVIELSDLAMPYYNDMYENRLKV